MGVKKKVYNSIYMRNKDFNGVFFKNTSNYNTLFGFLHFLNTIVTIRFFFLKE